MLAIGKRLKICFAISAGLLLAGRLTYAQNAVWSHHYGGYYNDGGYSSTPTPDGGYFAVGSTYSLTNDHDIFLLRLDSLGDTVWTRTFGGSATDYGRDVVVTSDSGCIIVGSTVSWSKGKEDLVLLGVSATGNLKWTKTYGGVNSDEGWSIRKTSDGNIIVCGTTSSSGAGYGDLWLLKLTTSGDSIWAKTFGGAGGESGVSVRDAFDGYIAVGATGSFGEGYSSIYAVKTNLNGDSVWAKAFGGPKADMAYSVEISNFGDYIIAGATGSYGQGYNDAYIIDITASGDVVWEKTYGGSKEDRAYSICTTPSGDLIVAGSTESSGQGAADLYLLRLNPIGDLIWSKTFGGTLSDYGRSVSVDARGNYIIAGYSYSFSIGGSDVYLLSVTGDAPTPVEELPAENLPDGFSLEQNYPNPFNGITNIQFSLPKREAFTLTIYNLLGQQVRQWTETAYGPGLFQVAWDGTTDQGDEAASGVYLYRFVTRDFASSKKMILVK